MSLPEPRPRSDIVCYHEAGHAVACWHYGVELHYVCVRHVADGAHLGETKTIDRASVTGGAELEAEMNCDAAGDIAQKRLFPTQRVPTDRELLAAWEVFPARLSNEPELAVEDTAGFLRNAQVRDEEIRKMGTGAPTGPTEWLRIWRAAEHLLRGELWPAVEAVA